MICHRRIQNRKLKFSKTMTFLLTINLLIIMNLQCRCMQFQKKVKYKRLRSVLETFMRRCVNQTEALRKFRYENMKVEKDTAVAKQSNTDDKNERIRSTCYAELSVIEERTFLTLFINVIFYFLFPQFLYVQLYCLLCKSCFYENSIS